MNQLNFLDNPPPYQKHSRTSRQAATDILPHLNRLEKLVYDYFKSCGEYGSTDEEGIEATGLSQNTYRPRRIKLTAPKPKGFDLLKDSGQTRKTKAGRNAVVWKLTQQEAG